MNLRTLIVGWLRGQEVGQIGETYLSVVTDDTYRYEQLSEFIAQVLEHLLPWLLNTLVGWANEDLAEEDQLCPELPAYIRFGVNTPVSLELAQAGVRSRRLVHAVAAGAAASTSCPSGRGLPRPTFGPGGRRSTPARASSATCSCSAGPGTPG